MSEALDRLLQERQADRLPSVAAAVVRAASSRGRTRSGRRTTTRAARRRPTRSTGSARSPRRSRRPRSCNCATRVGSTSTTGWGSTSRTSPTARRRCAACSLTSPGSSARWARCSSTARRRRRTTSTWPSRSSPRARTTIRTSRSACWGRSSRAKSGLPYIDYVNERVIGPLGSRAPPGRRTSRGRAAISSTSMRGRSGRSLRPTSAASPRWASCGRRSRISRRWATFLARGEDGVLDAKTVEEMWFPQVMYYPDEWVLGWGLGLMLYNQRRRDLRRPRRRDGRVTSPASYIDRKSQVGAAALTNSGTRGDMELLAIRLAAKASELWPDRSRSGGPRRSRRPTCARCSGAGGRRVTSSSSGGRAARCRRRSRARRPGRARRRSSATATAGAPPGPRARRAAARRRRPDVWAGYPSHAPRSRSRR